MIFQISFLNITGFRDFPLGDLPMLQVRDGCYCSYPTKQLPVHVSSCIIICGCTNTVL